MTYSEEKPLETVIDENLYFHHFQPIFEVNGLKAFGYEGLIRSQYARNPQMLFDAAIRSKRLSQLDMDSLFMAIDHLDGHFRYFEENSQFFLNVYPSTLMSEHFTYQMSQFIDSKDIPANQLVLELNESETIEDLFALRTVIKDLQSLGIQVALDDIGKGVSPFNRVLELNPDIIKLDKFFADDLSSSPRKQSILKGIMDYCNAENIQAILEGIENNVDLEVAESIGIRFVQGFLLGKPDTLYNHFSMAHHHQ